MTPEERRRAGGAVAERIAELGMTIPQAASKAGVDATTIRAFVQGRRWPHDRTRAKIAEVLGWHSGDVARRALEGYLTLHDIPTLDLLRELCRRAEHGQIT